VEGAPEFFANGVLVHNCSAGRYVIYGMHDIYMDSGAQSPEQVEAQRQSQGEIHGPAAIPFGDQQTSYEREAMAAEASWRAAV
jgi:hypothetical protein